MEIPSVQSEMATQWDETELKIICVILGTNDTAALMNYKQQKGISFSMFAHSEFTFEDYEVGWIYGNYPPTYFIINEDGIIDSRFDSLYGIAHQIKQRLESIIE